MKLTRTLSAIALACSLAISAPAMADDLDTAMQYANQQNYPQAFAIFKRLAEQGDANAQYNLGLMYDNGYGIKQDYAQAVSWYRKAAEQWNADAQYNLGNMYSDGQGVRQSHSEAMIWWQKAYA